MRVFFRDGTAIPAKVVARDRKHDLAILELSRAAPVPLLQLDTTGHLEIGDPAFALIDWTITRGIVGGLSGSVVQTDAAVSPDNDGGPLLSAEGRVVAVFLAKRGDRLALAVRARLLAELLPKIGSQGLYRGRWEFRGTGALGVMGAPDIGSFFGAGSGSRCSPTTATSWPCEAERWRLSAAICPRRRPSCIGLSSERPSRQRLGAGSCFPRAGGDCCCAWRPARWRYAIGGSTKTLSLELIDPVCDISMGPCETRTSTQVRDLPIDWSFRPVASVGLDGGPLSLSLDFFPALRAQDDFEARFLLAFWL